MNGFISRKAIRFTLVASACLLTGFVSGSNFHGFNFDALFPKKEINYSKIGWISSAFEENKVSFAKVVFTSSALENQEIKLVDFHLPTEHFSSPHKIKNHRKNSRRSPLQELGEVVARIQSFDLFKDYRTAHQKMHDQFILAMNAPLPKVLENKEVMLAQNKAPVPQKIASVPVKIKPRVHKIKNVSHIVKLDKQKMNIQKNRDTSKVTVIPIKIQPDLIPITENKIKTIQSSALASNNIQEAVEKSDNEILGNKLENQLLEQHVQLTQEQKKTPPEQYARREQTSNTPQAEEEDILPPIPPEPVPHGWSPCNGLSNLHLIKPGQEEQQENTQICPQRKTWLSKNWNNEGWLKLETEGYFPLLTYYPQINSEKTLLLDQNSVALLAIKSGVRFQHEMGMILGTLPQGYTVEFSGRAEEVQYFDLYGKKYFIILNVEPGAGVTELRSEKNQNENASVFTPILGDTVTYLDLATPVVMNIPVKVVKTKEKNDVDLAGLKIEISTQTQTQAMTQSNGYAVLKNARIIPGYPVFVDASSKFNEERSYQYRYQLNKRTKDGVFVLRQYPEKIIYQWLKQIKQGLSDQGGMIFGQFNRKKLDGFKKHYTVKVEALSEKFGLSAKNFTVLWDEKLSEQDPLEGDRPRFLSVQVPEGLTQTHLVNEENQIVQSSLIPVSPRVINVVSE